MQWQKLALMALSAQILFGGTLHFTNGDLTRPLNFSDYLTDGAIHFRAGKSHFLLVFNGPIGQDQLALLTRAGGSVVAFIPDNSVMVAAPDTFDPSSLNIEFATRLRPERKRDGDATFTSVIEFHADVDPAEAETLLNASGLTVLNHPDLLSNHFLVLGDTAGLEQWDEVDFIFPASADLLNGTHVYACASVVSGKAATPMYVTSGHGWTPNGMDGVTLQYTFSNLTPKVSSFLTVQELTRALNQWPKYANVHFTPGLNPQGTGTVAIKFAEFEHGDGFPFDGTGGVLAHTFYPVPANSEPIAGDMHLDGSENWNVGTDTDIYTVALHEIGHALGLAHSTVASAIMYPYYHLGKQISSDDINGIQSLYGPPSWSHTVLPISLVIQSPIGSNIQTTADTEAITGAVSNASGAPLVTWQTDHGQTGIAAGSSAWSIPSVPLSLGSNNITITVTDSIHQSATQALQVTRNAVPPVRNPSGPDTVPPSVSIQSPSSTILRTNQSSITLSGIASDNVGVAKVTWQNALMGSGDAVGTTSWSAAAVPLYFGTNTLIIRAFDAAGNNSWRSITVVRN